MMPIAFVMDLLLGDPLWIPHPVRMMGWGIARLENRLRLWPLLSGHERLSGGLLTLIIVFSSWGISRLMILWGQAIHPGLGVAITIYLAYTVLATKSLGDEAREVFNRLDLNDLPSARQQLSRIVGRDTEQLSEVEIIRATVETVAENSSDGIIAPLFYLTIGGPPLAMAYKAINTLDSMVGYRTDRYRDLGWASARLDDLANYLPARITGLLMVLGASIRFRQGRRALQMLLRDGRKHDSPNAGIPESATAGALGIQLGGPSCYDGVIKKKPWLGQAEKTVQAGHIEDAVRLMQTVSFLMLILSFLIGLSG